MRSGETTRHILMKMNCKKGGINKILTTNPDLLKQIGTKIDIVKSMMTDDSTMSPIITSALFADRIENALKKYYLGTGRYPKKVVICRSDASTGQLEEIAVKKVDLCRGTIEQFCQQFKVEISLLIYASVRQSEVKIVGTSINDSDPAIKQNVKPGTTILLKKLIGTKIS
uniref:Uncharacterized protein n=1 Tax=Panagrolaimus sp. JU765 TaxID=591449 RepID=A0AC34Q0R7_9BILA